MACLKRLWGFLRIKSSDVMLRIIGDSNHFLSLFFLLFPFSWELVISHLAVCCKIMLSNVMHCTDVQMFLFCCVLVLFTSFEGLRIYSYLVRGLMVCLKILSGSSRIIIVFRCWEGSETLSLKFVRFFLTKICLLGVQYFLFSVLGNPNMSHFTECLFVLHVVQFKISLLWCFLFFFCFTSLEGLRI